jgi:DNA invertase Pin-like site-specific DNA recombinase
MANDPATLKAEIARLKQELAAAPKEVDTEALHKAEEAGYRRGYDQGVAAMLTVSRDELQIVLDFLQPSDVLMVTRIDRLARSIGDLPLRPAAPP